MSLFRARHFGAPKASQVAAVLVVLLGCGLFWRNAGVRPLNEFDQPFYLGIAKDLVDTGRFTNGFMFAEPGADGWRPSGMRFAPLYPALLAVAAEVDGGLRQGMDCVVASDGKDAACPSRAPSVRWLQFLELAGVFWLVWWLGRAVGGEGVGWLSLLVAFGTAPLLVRSVDYLMTEMTCLLLTTGAMAAAIQAVRGARPVCACAAAGMLLGLAALTRPAFLYLIPASGIGALIWARRRAVWPVLGMGAAAILVLGPWVLRNWLVLGRAALTYGYDSHTLVQRIAFDSMSWREYGLSYVCWLPDGNEIGRGLAGAGACDRFGWDEHPNSFYVLGLRHLLYETLAAAGGYSHHLSYLLHAYIFKDPLKHILVSIPLALRGAYVAHWWGFVLLFACAGWTWCAVRGATARRPAMDFAPELYCLVALPPLFMLCFNAAVAVNQVRYNLLLIPAYAIAGGLTLRWVAECHGRRRVWSVRAASASAAAGMLFWRDR